MKTREVLEERVNFVVNEGYKIKFDNIDDLGWTDTKEKIIYINRNIDSIVQQFVFVHESFHANNANPDSQTFYFSNELEDADRKAFALLKEAEDFDMDKLMRFELFSKLKDIK